MNTMRRKTVRRGFTLIELLLVLMILAVLAGVVIPNYVRRGEAAKFDAARASIHMLGAALDLYENDCGQYPTTEDGLAALIEAPAGVTNWNGKYIKSNEVPLDPWGNPFVYVCPGKHNTDSFDLAVLGHESEINNWSTPKK